MTTTPSLDDDLALAHTLANIASGVSLAHFRRDIGTWSKADGSIATDADLAVEDALRARLAVDRPDDAILGEERGATSGNTRRWIIDAIDGTIDFAAGGPDWGTLIALEIDGRVAVGVCDSPVHKRRYWAARGRGAFRTGPGNTVPQRLHVSETTSLRHARGFVPGPQWQPDQQARDIVAAVTAAARIEPYVDHPALQLAYGGFDVVVFFVAGIWDLAAPSIVVEEAGGRFTNFEGANDLASGNAAISNGILHDDLLSTINGAGRMSS